MKKAILIATGTILMGIAACKKKSDDPVTPSQILSNTWNYDTAAFDTNKDGVPDQPLGALEQECDTDNTFTFNADGTGVADEGAIKCDDGDPQQTNFGWSLKSDSVMTITGDIVEQLKGDANILELSTTTLRLSKSFELTTPIPFNANLIITLKR